jgi:hypothetical protein
LARCPRRVAAISLGVAPALSFDFFGWGEPAMCHLRQSRAVLM